MTRMEEQKALLHYRIVEHLRQRFKERFNIELTRELRLNFLDQIHKRTAELCFVTPKCEIWKLCLRQRNCITRCFFVIYARNIDQITTVLPPFESPEFDEFCKTIYDKYGVTREKIMNRRKSPRELDNESLLRIQERDELNAFREKRACGRYRLNSYRMLLTKRYSYGKLRL